MFKLSEKNNIEWEFPGIFWKGGGHILMKLDFLSCKRELQNFKNNFQRKRVEIRYSGTVPGFYEGGREGKLMQNEMKRYD